MITLQPQLTSNLADQIITGCTTCTRFYRDVLSFLQMGLEMMIHHRTDTVCFLYDQKEDYEVDDSEEDENVHVRLFSSLYSCCEINPLLLPVSGIYDHLPFVGFLTMKAKIDKTQDKKATHYKYLCLCELKLFNNNNIDWTQDARNLIAGEILNQLATVLRSLTEAGTILLRDACKWVDANKKAVTEAEEKPGRNLETQTATAS